MPPLHHGISKSACFVVLITSTASAKSSPLAFDDDGNERKNNLLALSVRLDPRLETMDHLKNDVNDLLKLSNEKKRGTQIPYFTPPKPRKRRRRGRFFLDLQGNYFHLLPPPPLITEEDSILNANNETNVDTDTANNPPPTIVPDETRVFLRLDPHSALAVARLASSLSISFSAAFMGTLRLLAPMIVARRSIKAGGDFIYDYMMGRYVRRTKDKLNELWYRHFDFPAVFRSFGRIIVQLLLMSVVSKVLSTALGHSADQPTNWWAPILWTGSMLGTGHVFSRIVEYWGGPLQIREPRLKPMRQSRRRYAARVFSRPWHILQMMQDPEAWISMIATPSSTTRKTTFDHSFDPNPVLFPATWVPLKLLQQLAVAEALSSSAATKQGNWKSSLVKEFMVQTALANEWHRVFLTEHRVVLGTIVVLVYLLSSLWLIMHSMSRMDVFGAVLMIPQLFAVVISAWMTSIICMDRHYLDEEGKRPLSILDFVQKQAAPLKVIQWYPPYSQTQQPTG